MRVDRDIHEVVHEVAKKYVAMEVGHAEMHVREGVGSFAVREQQTGHVVCGWCGYCDGSCVKVTHRG